MLTLEPPTLPPIEEDDYGYALVHLAWFRESQRRFLLFGFVELLGTVALPEPGWVAGQPPKEQLATAKNDLEPPWPDRDHI